MGHGAIAVRYARALMDVLRTEDDLIRVGRDLAAVSTLLAEHADLGEALDRSTLPRGRRRHLAQTVLKKMGVHRLACRLVSLLAEQTRVALLDEIREAFQDLCDARRRILSAQVTTAVPLPAAECERYRLSLARFSGQQVKLKTEVDPAILGGVVTRIGSKVYDGSLRSRLQRLQHRLRGE